MNSYELSRNWFNYAFDNPEKIKPIHTAIYFFAIEHCNRLGWKEKFGFPSQMVMEAIGVKNWRTYSKALNDLVDFGFINMIEISKNQYSSNIVAIVKNTKAPTKALDKALSKHSAKQGQSTVSIDKQLNNEQLNNEQVGSALVFLETNAPTKYEAFLMQNKKSINDWETFKLNFEDKVTIELGTGKLKFETNSLLARLNSYCRSWLSNQQESGKINNAEDYNKQLRKNLAF